MKIKLPKLSMKHNLAVIIIVAVILGIFFISFFGLGFMMAIEGFAGGWECRTKLEKVYIGGEVNKWYGPSTAPLGDIPWSTKNVQFDPSLKINPDWQYEDEPDIFIHVDDPIHTNEDRYHKLLKSEDGTKVIQAPLDAFVREIPRDVGGERRFYYHHVYAYVVTVKTGADAKDLGGLYQVQMETKGEEGSALYFTVKSSFAVDPWNILGDIYTDPDTGETYSVSTAWAGIMSSSVELVVAGFTDRNINSLTRDAQLATVTSGWDIVKPELYSATSMTTETGTPVTNEVPANPQYIENVPQKVLIDVSGMLFAGTKQGAFVYPVAYDLFMQITIRVDVLTVAGFTPVTGTTPLPDPPDDIREGPAPFLYPLLYALGQYWGANWWMYALIVGAIVLFLLVIVISRVSAVFKIAKAGASII